MLDEYVRLVDSIIALRKQKGLSQKKLASQCGLTQSVIGRIESKKSVPTVETLIKILKPLECTLVTVETQAAFQEVQAMKIDPPIGKTYDDVGTMMEDCLK